VIGSGFRFRRRCPFAIAASLPAHPPGSSQGTFEQIQFQCLAPDYSFQACNLGLQFLPLGVPHLNLIRADPLELASLHLAFPVVDHASI
jgi:hypothetical protein